MKSLTESIRCVLAAVVICKRWLRMPSEPDARWDRRTSAMGNADEAREQEQQPVTDLGQQHTISVDPPDPLVRRSKEEELEDEREMTQERSEQPDEFTKNKEWVREQWGDMVVHRSRRTPEEEQEIANIEPEPLKRFFKAIFRAR